MDRDDIRALHILIDMYEQYNQQRAFVAEDKEGHFNPIAQAYEDAINNLIKELANA